MQSNHLKTCVSGIFLLVALQVAAIAATIASLPEASESTTESAAWAALVLSAAAAPAWRLLHGFIKQEQKNYVRSELKNASMQKEMQRVFAEAHDSEKASRLYRHIALALADKESLSDAVGVCVKEICLYADWPVGQAFVAEGESGTLSALAGAEYCRAPSDYAAFLRSGKEATYAIGAGAVGRSARDGQAKWSAEPPFDEPVARKEAAAACGLKGVYAFPIKRGGTTELVLEFYLPTARRPDKNLLQTIERTGAYVALFLQRRALEMTLQNERIYAERVAKARADVMNGAAADLLHRLNAMDAATEKLCRNAAIGLYNDDIQLLRRHISRSGAMLKEASSSFGDGATATPPARLTFAPHALLQNAMTAVKTKHPSLRGVVIVDPSAQEAYQGDGERLGATLRRATERMVDAVKGNGRVTLRFVPHRAGAAISVTIPMPKDAYRALEKSFWGVDVAFGMCRAAIATMGGKIDAEYDSDAQEARLSLLAPVSPSAAGRASDRKILSAEANDSYETSAEAPVSDRGEWRYYANEAKITAEAS
ncbi:MAG: GAF domain-containing protein [Rickettsiales bacterium]